MHPGGHVQVGGRPLYDRTEVPARGNGQHVPNTRAGGRDIRQIPGGDHYYRNPRNMPNVINVPEPVIYRVPHVSVLPSRHHVHVMGPGVRTSKVAALIVGIALAIFGACIFPVDPAGGFVITGFGLALAAIGALSKSRDNTDQY